MYNSAGDLLCMFLSPAIPFLFASRAHSTPTICEHGRIWLDFRIPFERSTPTLLRPGMLTDDRGAILAVQATTLLLGS